MSQKPWRQLAFVIGEAILSLTSSGAIFILISRLSGPDLLGTYALALAWLMVFQGMSNFGIPGFLMREVGAFGRNAVSQVVHALLLGLGSGLVAVVLMVVAVRVPGYSANLVEVITIASLALIPSSLGVACRSVFLALRMMHLTFLGALVEAAIVMSASLYFLLSGDGAVALMIVLVCAKIASAAIAVALLHLRVFPLRPPFDAAVLVRTAATVFSFGISGMLSMLTMRINTILVSFWVDIATVGQFAAATKIMEIGLMAPNLFIQLVMTRAADSFNAGNRDPNRYGPWFRMLYAIVVPTCVGGWVFAELFLETLFGPAFGDAAWVLRIFMIYLLIEAADAVMSAILQAAHLQREDVRRLAFNPVANIALNLLLLPGFGTIGAAIGRLGGVAVSAILRHLLIARELAAIDWVRWTLKPVAICVAVGAACHALRDVVPAAWLLLAYASLTAGLLVASSSLSVAAIRDIMKEPAGKD